MLSPLKVDEINRNCAMYFGFFPGTDKANYRISWAPDNFEKRQGIFAKFDNSGNYIGTDNGIKLVPKYLVLGDCYVIEKLIPNVMGDEVKTDEKLVYEAFFNFTSKSGKPLDPNWEAVKYVIMLAVHGDKHTAEYYMAQDESSFQAEVDKFEAALNQ